jgi:hypothetical protein
MECLAAGDLHHRSIMRARIRLAVFSKRLPDQVCRTQTSTKAGIPGFFVVRRIRSSQAR